MPTLSPEQAAVIAMGVYALRTQTISQVQAKQARDKDEPQTGYEGLFAVGQDSGMQGASGVRDWRPISGFGYVAAGVNQFKDEAIIALRGTDQISDWLTDANFSSKGGIHTGFFDTWNSLKPEVDKFFHGKRFKTIHCVGHSLGGALATIAAMHCTQRGYGAPELYTFGCPRVGKAAFAQKVTTAIGASRIHRVAHYADPVTMIPRYPYVHAPASGEVILIGKDSMVAINPLMHMMKHSYKPMIGQVSWGNATVPADVFSDARDIEAWLRTKGNGSSSQLSVYDLQMVIKSMNLVTSAMSEGRSRGVGMAAYGGMSALDWLSETEREYQRAKFEFQLRAAKTVVKGHQIQKQIEAERDRQVLAAAKAIYVYTGQGAKWTAQQAKTGANAAIEAHAQAAELLDQHIYQPIYRMARQAVQQAQ
jgi:triacylglycerol lipase